MKLDTKKFRYKLGHEAGTTLTVGGLMEALTQYPYDMPVFVQWEGVNAFVGVENFDIEEVTKGHDDDKCDCLVIDVNHY